MTDIRQTGRFEIWFLIVLYAPSRDGELDKKTLPSAGSNFTGEQTDSNRRNLTV